jgi:polyphosphate kinase
MDRKQQALLDLARLHVRQWFAKRMPKRMRFHDLEHTMGVTRTALALAESIGLSGHDLFALELAALFHDTGYALAYDGHEERSVELALAFLRKHRVPARTASVVRGLIRATRLGAPVRTQLQRLLRDADSAKAGQVDFAERSEALRKELELVKGTRISDRDWLRANIAYLEAHRFLTPQARTRFSAQKRINLAGLRAQAALPKERLRLAQPPKPRYVERDLSWLSFNDRVLQEAMDERNPLLERVKFLAIYSSNLDEFYRVRVASLRSLAKLKRSVRSALELPPGKLVDRINQRALEQQRRFGRLWRETLLPAMAQAGIRILHETELSPAQADFLRTDFTRRIAPLLNTAAARAGNAPFIEDRKLYFVVRLRSAKGAQRLVLVNIPSDEAGRFIVLPSSKGRTDIIFIDDAMRACLGQLFTGHRILGCHAIKLSRDAELYLDEEFSGNMKEKVRKSLRKRTTGVPARFLYDSDMPRASLRAMRTLLGLGKADLVPGGRYHHFSDLLRLPVQGHAALRDRPWPPLAHPALARQDLFRAAARRDVLLHFPYHGFGQFTDWLWRAARDRAVRTIRITLYRVAEGSTVCSALIEALKRGKQVVVFVEVQARFDEGSNLYWGEQLEKAGARVLYSYADVKVHCKLCLVERMENGRLRGYAYFGTGNFNERTARIYADEGLITVHQGLVRDAAEVFRYLEDRTRRPRLSHALLAPITLRTGLEALIDKEMEQAAQGRPAALLLKLNSLEDRALINKLYEAARAGVEVRIIVRGICCLVPGSAGTGHLITAISIVDRYLEHSRAFVFHNAGDPRVFLASADWMGRNLDRRVEVAFPLLDPALRDEMLHLLELQWTDRTKARLIDAGQTNPYLAAPVAGRKRAGHAQADIHRWLRRKGGVPLA